LYFGFILVWASIKGGGEGRQVRGKPIQINIKGQKRRNPGLDFYGVWGVEAGACKSF
jgi:hypothetical protein